MSDESSYDDHSQGGRAEPFDDPDDELPMHLLAAGIPLTLLLDLAENFGPPSHQILESEVDEPENWIPTR